MCFQQKEVILILKEYSLISNNMFILNILPYLILTIVSEELCLFIMKENKVHIYIVCLVMNIFTNLSLNIILQFCNNYYLFLFVLEVIVYLFEFFIYLLVSKEMKKSFIYSIILNSISLLLGFFI